MPKRSAARRAEEDTGRDEPSRPDNIPSQENDNPGSIESIHDDKPGVVDVNATPDREDARSDAEKQQEVDAANEQRLIRERQNEIAPEGVDEENSQQARRERRRKNREEAASRASDERVSNLTAENRRLSARLAKIERGGNQQTIETNINSMKAQIEALKKDLFAHTEGGKTAEALDVQIKIGEIQARLALAERDLEAAKRQPDPEPEVEEETASSKPVPKLVEDWKRANRSWMKTEAGKSLTRHLGVIDMQILADIDDGLLDYEKYSEDHMDEMTKRLVAKAEELGLDVEIKDFNGEVFEIDEEEEQSAANGRDKGKEVTTTGKRPAAGGMGGRQGNRKPPTDLELARQGKARLLPADYAQMRVFKLDPNDEKARKAFAKERVRTILTEAAKAGGRR